MQEKEPEMQAEKENQPETEQNSQPEADQENLPAGKVSAFRNAAEQQAKLRRDEELKERKRQKAAEEAAYRAREEYAKELAEEKVDLIRLKQGVITDSDKVFREDEAPKEYTIWQRIGNWFYHAKWWLGIAAFVILLGAFLIYDYVTRVDPDFRLLLLSENAEFESDSYLVSDWLAEMVPDYNGDGKQIAEVLYVPVSKVTMEMGGTAVAAYNTQLYVQFQSDTCMLVLADPDAEEYLQPADMFVSMEELYPDCPFAESFRLHIDGTNFTELANVESELKEGSYLALRIPEETMNSKEEMQAAYDKAKAVLDQIVPQLTPKS